MRIKLTPKYITDEKGRKTAVILPVKQYEALLEDLQDLAAIAEHRDEPLIPHQQVIDELKKDGLLYGSSGQ